MSRFGRVHMISYHHCMVTMAVCSISYRFAYIGQILVQNREIYTPRLYSMTRRNFATTSSTGKARIMELPRDEESYVKPFRYDK